MLKSLMSLAAIASLILFSAAVSADDKEQNGPVLSGKINTLEGKPVDLSQYKGKVVLVVNVASKCGLTPQYEALEKLHEKYAGEGLAVLGFPCNQFGSQEPGTEKEIREFCDATYGVKFDLFEKVNVNGDEKSELYRKLTDKEAGAAFPGPITWNFEKFLIGRDGKVLARFAPRVKPDSPEVVKAIEAELANK